MIHAIVSHVMTGRLAVLTPDGEMSAIRKTERRGPVSVSHEGLDGDEHAYHGHGGPDKAILHCAAEHYHAFAERFPEFTAGVGGGRTGFGDNISTKGIAGRNVCVGDRYRIGPIDREHEGIVVEVSGFRQPCWKLGYVCGIREIPTRMQDLRCPGWYYRVIETGEIRAGDSIALVERPHPDWTIARLVSVLYSVEFERRALEPLLNLRELGAELRSITERRLATGAIESWDARLYRRSRDSIQPRSRAEIHSADID
jgi:MOSC domain-containing protein YiiM